MLMQFLTTHACASGKYKTDIISMCLNYTLMFSLNVLSMITLKYSTQALSRLVCAYTFKLPHVWDISRAEGGGGGGVHTSHIVKTLVSVELTSVLRLVRATSYNTRAGVIAGGSRHSINTSIPAHGSIMRHYIYRVTTFWCHFVVYSMS